MSTDTSFVGMAGFGGSNSNSSGGVQSNKIQHGNVNGDQVDNTAGKNYVTGPTAGNPVVGGNDAVAGFKNLLMGSISISPKIPTLLP